MAIGLSTFAQTEQKLEAAEQTAQQPQTTETSATAVNENGNLENTNGQQTETTQVTEAAATTETQTQEPEQNTSEFKIGFGEETETNQTAQAATTSTPSFNLDEELKKVDRKEVLKKLGVNDFALEIDEYLQKGGKAIDYLNAKSVDYNSFSDEDIIKSDLKKQYPTFTPQQIDLMFNRKYTVNEAAEDEEKEFVQLQLKADAYNSRQAKISEQQKFKIPETPILQKDEAYEQWKQQQDAQPVMMEKLKQFYESHDATKLLNESKRVAISLGEGVAPFNFSIDRPEYLTKLYTDGGETWQRLTSTKSGEPDVQKQHLIGLFSFDPIKFSQDIFNYGMQMGKKKLVEEGQNAQRPQQKAAPPELNGTASYSTGKYGDKQR